MNGAGANDWDVLYLARVVLQTRTPLSIATGISDGSHDTQLVRDANGLPAIPGTSLAGVLRHLYQDTHGEDKTRELFGFAEGNAGSGSRLEIGWGCIHDSDNMPIEGLRLGESEREMRDDALLAFVLQEQPLVRDRVRLTHRGTAADQGKFDRTVLPAGYRFSVELVLRGKRDDESDWKHVLNLFDDPGFRLGGASRAGLGAMDPVAIRQRAFAMREPTDYQAFRALGRSLVETKGLEPHKIGTQSDHLTISMTLKPDDFWRFGGGSSSLGDGADGKPANMLPVSEARVAWFGDGHGDDRGELREAQVLVPASAIKGALSHRIAFHHRRLSGQWADTLGEQQHTENEAVRALFGYCKDSDDESREGRAGKVLIDDVYLDVDKKQNVGNLMHTAIDRFTGGVRQGMLFSEEAIYGVEIPLTIRVLNPRKTLDQDTHRALACALEDLADGRLALGAAAGRGHGFFSSDKPIVWSDET